MNRLIASLVTVLFSLPAVAIIDETVDWSDIRIGAVVDKEPVSVSARVDGQRLIAMTVIVRGKTLSVPAAELVGLPPALALRSIRIVSPDRKMPPGPTLRVVLEALPLGEGHPVSARVSFHFGNLSYTGRLVEFVKAGKVTARETKLLGQPFQSER